MIENKKNLLKRSHCISMNIEYMNIRSTVKYFIMAIRLRTEVQAQAESRN